MGVAQGPKLAPKSHEILMSVSKRCCYVTMLDCILSFSEDEWLMTRTMRTTELIMMHPRMPEHVIIYFYYGILLKTCVHGRNIA